MPFEEYRLYITENADKFFYKNRMNIFGISAKRIAEFLNDITPEYNFRFIGRRKINETALRKIIGKSLNKGLPVIIRVGENFNRLPYKIYFGTGENNVRQDTMRWHYITITGLENDTLIFCSWGRKGEMILSDLCNFFGFTGGVIAAE